MILYLGIIVTLLAFEVAYLQVAKKIGIVDRPHHQSSHTGVVIRGGGILFYVAYLLWFIMYDYQYPMIFAGLTIMAVTSFADDVHSISPKVRLVLQFAAMIVMLYETRVFSLPFYPLLALSIACVGGVNIYNFMDGINGMTGGYSFIVVISLMFTNNFEVTFIDEDLLIFIMIAIAIFLIFNFRRRAKCFAGDVGSLSIGFIVIFLILKLIFATGHSYWMAFVGVYGVDGGLTILHRLTLRENILKPHKKHAYQIMANELKMSHLKVSLIYMGLQAVCCAWLICFPGNITLLLQITILVLLYYVFMKKYYHLHVGNQ